MNEDFDIGNYKPEELQLRKGNDVVAIFKNNLGDELNRYLVVYNNDGIHFSTYTKQTGEQYSGDEHSCDVILKSKFHLKDYISKPELLVTTTGDKVLSVVNHPLSFDEIFIVTTFDYIYENCHVYECYFDGKFKNNVGFVTLKTHVKSVEKPSKLPELYELFKQYTKVMEDEGIDLRLYDDEACELYDSDNDKICDRDNFEEMIEFFKEKLK